VVANITYTICRGGNKKMEEKTKKNKKKINKFLLLSFSFFNLSVKSKARMRENKGVK